MTVETFNEVVTEGAVQLMSKWYNEAVIPRNKVQNLINDIKLINLNSIDILKNEVINNLKTNENNPRTISKISNMFDILKNPFKDLETEYLRLNTLERLGVYIKPVEISIGNRLKNVIKNGNTVLDTVKINEYIIPLRLVFKKFFEQPNVLITVLKYFNELKSMQGNIISSYLQSKI